MSSFLRIAGIVAVSVLIGNMAVTAIALAWTGPTSTAPNGNVAAPINVGATDQVKNGNLGVSGLAVFGNSILQANSYLNWGATVGSSGYGVRDNAGTLEFKNSGGSWASLQATIAALAGSQWTTNGTHIYNANSGNVGIGVSSPSHKLDVAGSIRINPAGTGWAYLEVGTGATANRYAYVDLVGDTTYTDYGLRLLRANSGANAYSQLVHRGSGNLAIQTVEAAPIVFITSSAERLRILANGNVGIGTTNPSYKLTVDGNVGAAGFFHTSDARLKEHIETAPGLSLIERLRGVTFEWKADGHPSSGVIAQEVERVFPRAVRTDANGLKMVEYDQLIAPMIEAIKEQQLEIERLIEENARQQAMIESLEARAAR